MAGIKEPIQSLLTKLATINVTTPDGIVKSLYARVWNNQLRMMIDGQSYSFQRPACFVEVINSVNYEILGQGLRAADLGFRLHLIHDFYNLDGTLEQDLSIFDLRDNLLLALRKFTPTSCGPINCIREEQDYEHENIYHYVLDYVCCFIDTKQSDYDTSSPLLIESAPNPDIDLEQVTEFKTQS
jgi:hypothetical protein